MTCHFIKTSMPAAHDAFGRLFKSKYIASALVLIKLSNDVSSALRHPLALLAFGIGANALVFDYQIDHVYDDLTVEIRDIRDEIRQLRTEHTEEFRVLRDEMRCMRDDQRASFQALREDRKGLLNKTKESEKEYSKR